MISDKKCAKKQSGTCLTVFTSGVASDTRNHGLACKKEQQRVRPAEWQSLPPSINFPSSKGPGWYVLHFNFRSSILEQILYAPPNRTWCVLRKKRWFSLSKSCPMYKHTRTRDSCGQQCHSWQ